MVGMRARHAPHLSLWMYPYGGRVLAREKVHVLRDIAHEEHVEAAVAEEVVRSSSRP